MKNKVTGLICGFLLLCSHCAQGAEIKLTFVHVNDVYELQPRNGLGGVAFLGTLLKEYRQKDPQLVFTFGGDLLSPSMLSGMVQGSQMVEALNALHVDVAVFGNHEFDFGPETLEKQISKSQTSWLTTNISLDTGELFPGTRRDMLRKVHGIKVGFFGLTTPQTAQTSFPGKHIRFAPVQETARQAVATLKAQGAQVIVALTHLLLEEDRQLAATVEGIHLILGGHDHDPVMLYEHGVLIVKSGSDNQYVSVVELSANDQPGKSLHWHPAWSVRPVMGLDADPDMQTIVDRWQKVQDDTLGTPLLTITTAFDTLEDTVRSRENAFANLVTDAMREAVTADVALFNGGGLRGNRTYPAGYVFTPKDILTEMPFGNVTVLLELTGRDLLTVLEKALSRAEGTSGRFPHVSGMHITFDSSKPVGQRLVAARVGQTPLDPNRKYKVATTDYLASGKDGYDALQQGTMIVDSSAATLVANHVKTWLLAHKEWTPHLEGRVVNSAQPGQKTSQSEATILTRQLQRRFGNVPTWASEKIAKAELPALEAWSLQIFDAKTLDEVFADPA